MPTGTVKFFNHKSNFGFIRVDDTNEEIYVHGKSVEGEIKDNDRVSFEIESAKRGPEAKSVVKID